MVEETLINFFQTRMDKCTTEQFWVTGAITGMAAVLISESSEAPLESYGPIVVIVQIFLAICGIYFVIHRHRSFYKLEEKRAVLLEKVQAKLLEDDKTFQLCIERNGNPWRGDNLLGVGFYVLWIVITTLGVIACYLD